MSSNDDTDKDKLNEPSIVYRANRLQIFSSFEEAHIVELETTLMQTPVERIRETVQLILRVYGLTQAELNNRKRNNRITIIKSSIFIEFNIHKTLCLLVQYRQAKNARSQS